MSGNTSRRPDSTQLVRQWAILRLLANSGRSFSAKDLADQLEVSKSTVQRDLATLEQDFALVEEEQGKQKKLYSINQRIKALESISFGTMELLALHAAKNAVSGLAGTPFFDDLKGVVHKVRGFLSPRHNGGLDALSRVFLPHPRGYVDYSGQADFIDSLSDAVARRRVCEILYSAAWRGTTREHKVKPLRLLWYRSALYLLGVIEGRTEITTFAVHRIEDLRVLDDEFATPKVDMAAHTEKAFGIFVGDEEQDVEILFDKEIAWRVEERIFHPSEEKERLEDGTLSYRVRSSANWEIIPWVMQYGAMAELVKPAAWRALIAENAALVADRYGE